MEALIKEIRKCKVCLPFLEHGVNPVMAAHAESKIVIIGQAPGRIVHETGVAWDDKSGDALRGWLGVDKEVFYDAKKIAIIPMGFCYPGKGKSGDLPPRKECAPLYHDVLFEKMKKVQLTLLIGKYAQDQYLRKSAKRNLTETVRHFEEFLPEHFVLPHPSPRNFIWQAKNPWFTKDVLPVLRERVIEILR